MSNPLAEVFIGAPYTVSYDQSADSANDIPLSTNVRPFFPRVIDESPNFKLRILALGVEERLKCHRIIGSSINISLG